MATCVKSGKSVGGVVFVFWSALRDFGGGIAVVPPTWRAQSDEGGVFRTALPCNRTKPTGVMQKFRGNFYGAPSIRGIPESFYIVLMTDIVFLTTNNSRPHSLRPPI